MKVLKKNGYNLCFTLIVIVLALMPVLLMNGAVKSTTVLFLGKCIAFAIVALGLDLIWGYTGILSLGHGLYFCLGAYGMGMYLKMVQTHGWRTDRTSTDLEAISVTAGNISYDLPCTADRFRTDWIFYF